MQQTQPLRGILRFAGGLFALSAAAICMNGQNLPATPPTTLPGQTAAAPATPSANPPLHAEVIYKDGRLQVRADNSSLNQILRSISHVTGLKITGGVEEQRVFGNYGPAPLSTVLATLLDGTEANILLMGGSAGSPPELILTNRNGGPEPPGPGSPAYAMYDSAAPVPPPSTRAQVPPSPMVTPQVVEPAAPAMPSAGVPGKTLTPEMVEQELMQMQAKQDQKKKELDQKLQQQQVDQQKKLNMVQPSNSPQ